MFTDIKLYDIKRVFTAEAENEYKKYSQLLKEVIASKIELYNYLLEHKDFIKKEFVINLDDIEEWNNNYYSDKEYLYNKAIKRYREYTYDNETKKILLQVIKYCNILRNEYVYENNIRIADIKRKLNTNQFTDYLRLYFNKVHEYLLKGGAYKFAKGTGIFSISYWEYANTDRLMIDFNETNKRKREFIKNNIKLYNKKEAAWCEARNIKYDGKDYRVYKKPTGYYRMEFTNVKENRVYEFEPVDTVPPKYRGLTHKELVDKYIKTEKDIYDFRVDLKTKIRLLSYIVPNSYLRFIRKEDAKRRNYRATYRKDR